MDGFKEETGLSEQKKERVQNLVERTEDVQVEDVFLLLYHIYRYAGERNKRTPT